MSAARVLLRRSPLLFCAVARTRQRDRRRVVSRRVDLTVEGYPRSGSSSFVAAATLAFPTATVASHVHDAAHVLRSRHLGRPTVVLVRDPRDAVVSTLVFRGAPGLGAARHELAAWIAFHRPLVGLDGIRVVPFATAVDDLAATMTWVGADLLGRPPVLGPGFEERVRAEVEAMNRAAQGGDPARLGVPTPERRDAAEATRRLLDDPGLADDLARARELHDAMVGGDRGQPGQ